MDQVCGIYKITNLVNNKCYIGQSINISSRWKQHTQSLDKIENPDGENPLRRAFLKYGLTQQVSQPGVYGNFKFEVLLECDRDDLTKNEYAKIEELQPEYNRMMCPPSADRMWPRKQNLEKCCYVQYHNFNALGYLPFEGAFYENKVCGEGYTTSKKRDCLKLKGEKVYLIVGIKQKGRKQKDFFLWSYTQVEEIEMFDETQYGVRGTDFICKKPVRLNDLPGFEHFAKHTMGSFAYGMQNAINDPFSKVLMNEKLFARAEKFDCKALQWLADFEDNLDDECLHLTKQNEKRKPTWNIFFLSKDNSVIAENTQRSDMVLKNSLDFFVERFLSFNSKNPQIETLLTYFAGFESIDLVKMLPNVEHRIVCGGVHESWNKQIQELSKYKNVVLMKTSKQKLNLDV